MILIGESIHMISRKISNAVDSRDPGPIQELARVQEAAGADYLDLNFGPLTKDPAETARWVVNTVQEAVEIPLSIDTLNPEALEAALGICTKPAIINSANGTRKSKDTVFPLAQKYGANLILMTVNDEGMASDADSRLEMAMELVEEANAMDIPNERIFVDGVLMPAFVNQEDIVQFLEFTNMLPDALPEVKTLTGLSNISSCGTPTDVRGILNRTFFIMLNRYGQSAIIADVTDKDLIRLNQGGLTEIVDLVYRSMDGEDIDTGNLSDIERDYVKTADMIMGKTFYSHSWLEE